MILRDLTNMRFGKLTVLSRTTNIGRHTAWGCLCDCGEFVAVRAQSLQLGDTRSCGCLRAEVMTSKQTKHGHYNSLTYHSYRSMLERCNDPECKCFYNYGGRGITVCQRWLDGFENFLADMGVRPADKTLDRIDVNGNYEPSNCRWADKFQQARNKRRSKDKATI